MAKGLTERQKRFACEYLADKNAENAAARAGYSKKSAYAAGRRLLKKPEVTRLIEDLKNQEKSQKCRVGFDDIVNELKKIGFSEIDYESVKVTEKMKALETISKMLGFDRPEKDEALEDMSAAEGEVFGGD